jgi:hypothetical protein
MDETYIKVAGERPVPFTRKLYCPAIHSGLGAKVAKAHTPFLITPMKYPRGGVVSHTDSVVPAQIQRKAM